jgi:hypothetical protein
VLAALTETITESLEHPKFFERFHATFEKLASAANNEAMRERTMLPRSWPRPCTKIPAARHGAMSASRGK